MVLVVIEHPRVRLLCHCVEELEHQVWAHRHRSGSVVQKLLCQRGVCVFRAEKLAGGQVCLSVSEDLRQLLGWDQQGAPAT